MTRTIDLGELAATGEPVVEPAWPGWRRLRRMLDRPGWLLAAAGTAVAMLLGLTASASTDPALRLRLSVAAESFDLGPRHLYVVDNAAPEPRVSAYRLTDGRLAWRTSLPRQSEGHLELYQPTGAALMVVGFEFGSGYPGDGAPQGQVLRLDPATGEIQWRVTGAGLPAAMTDEVVLHGRVAEPGEPQSRPLYDFSAVDLATGRPRWDGQVRGYSLHTDDRQARGVALGPGSTLRTIDLRTGETVATGAAVPAAGPGAQLVEPIGSTVLVSHHRPPGLSGYDLATLRHLWTYETAEANLARCGDRVCLQSPAGVQVLDPITGSLVWETGADWLPAPHHWSGTGFAGEHPLADYLLVSQPGPPPTPWLIDLDRGEPVLDLTGWSPAPARDPAGSDPVWAFAPATADRPGWAGWLRADLSGVEPVGEIHHADHCVVRHPHFACTSGSSQSGPRVVEVWQWQG